MASTDDSAARRAFWIEQLEHSYTLMATMRDHTLAECGEGFASIADAADAAGVEMLFSETPIVDELPRLFYIRSSLADPLMSAAREMNECGWILKIEDGYRSREMQRRLGLKPAVFDSIVRTCIWECCGATPPIELLFRRALCLVANIPANGTHLCGAAVDISVFRRDDGREVCRGKRYLEMSEYTPMQSPFVSPEAQQNRVAITAIMERHGFMHYPGEFWHYNQGDTLAQLLNGRQTPGRYGPVDWEPSENRVTPFPDILTPLTPPDQLAAELTRALARVHASEADR
jgi:D-alanyl-D-alanine dipeptidase